MHADVNRTDRRCPSHGFASQHHASYPEGHSSSIVAEASCSDSRPLKASAERYREYSPSVRGGLGLKRTVLITGTSSGLGLSMVRHFAERGWNVAATMRRRDRMSLFADLPAVYVIPLELTDPDSAVEAFANALRHFGRIDVLVNNAGYCLLGPLETTSMEQIRQLYDVHIAVLYT